MLGRSGSMASPSHLRKRHRCDADHSRVWSRNVLVGAGAVIHKVRDRVPGKKYGRRSNGRENGSALVHSMRVQATMDCHGHRAVVRGQKSRNREYWKLRPAPCDFLLPARSSSFQNTITSWAPSAQTQGSILAK